MAHLQNTPRHYPLPDCGKELAYKGNRAGGEEHFPEPHVRKTFALDVALIDHYDPLWGEVDLSITRPAKGHTAQHLSRRPSVPGMGKILAVVCLSELQALARFPRVQDFVSYGPLVPGATESAGNRLGTAGKTSGNPQLQWAFAAAAVLFLRQHHPGKDYFAQWARKPGKGKALTVRAPKLARAV